VAQRPAPPHDCRITLRCLKTTFAGFSIQIDQDLESLRSENSLIDHFFERRQNDPDGGEGGQRVAQIRTRPTFKLTSGRMRGATWFDCDHPPQGVVWLLGAEQHDERHKGRSDAYDILGVLDQRGELFPQEIDYDRLELDRRRWDQASFGEDVRRDATTLVSQGVPGGANGTLAGMPARIVTEETGALLAMYVAVSTKPVPGQRSGMPIAMTEERFSLLQIAVCSALEDTVGQPEVCEEILDRSTFPGRVHRSERVFGILLER
jgi:hypothetical protein